MIPNVRSIGSTPRGRHNPSGAEEIQPIAPASESDLDAFRDTAGTVRIGIWILLLGFGGFLLWASFAPLGEGVPTQGTVIVDTKRKPVQHRVGGIVKLVSVKEGQWVNEGDALFELEEEGLLAQLESSRQLYFALRATESRLRAEQSNERVVSFPPELVSLSSDQIASGHLENQRRLFASRRQALDSEQAAFEQSRLAQEAKLKGLKEVIEKRQQARNLLEEQRAQLQTLASQGYVPRHRYLELERQSTELDAALQDLRAAIETTERTIREIRLRADQRLSEYRKEVDMQLADVRRDVEGVEERFRASKKELLRTVIRAPVSGQVVGLQIQSTGAVIPPGFRIAEIVPKNESLIIEAKIPPQYIDRVKIGNEVDVRFSIFANTPQLVVPGRLNSLSNDLISDAPGVARNPLTPSEYYLARVDIDSDEALHVLNKRTVVAGMPAEIVIKTGERSLLRYLMRPLTKRIASALKEE